MNYKMQGALKKNRKKIKKIKISIEIEKKLLYNK